MVRCSDCGFLTLRNMFTGELDEVDSAFRATGNPPRRKVQVATGGTSSTGTQTPYRHIPICFARAYDLQSEIPGQLPQDQEDYPAKLVLEVISKDRKCPKRMPADGFTRWHQGFTPKEHREMLDRQETRDWQAKQDAKRTSERRLDALVLVFVAGGFTILGVVLSELLR